MRPPVDEGALLLYQIFVNASEALSSNSTVATIEINSTGQHSVDIRAINCAGISPNETLVINTTGRIIIRGTIMFLQHSFKGNKDQNDRS